MTTQDPIQLLKTMGIHIQLSRKYYAHKIKANYDTIYWNGEKFTNSPHYIKEYTDHTQLINDIFQHLANHL